MEIVLLERVDSLGAMGDVVNVKNGYARNYLLPQGKALRATKANLARFEAEREILEKRNAETAKKAAEQGADLEGKSFVVIRQAGDTGILYGSVSSRDIAELIGEPVKRAMVVLEKPIKALGLHDVRIKLHPEVSVNVIINVARTEDEAERQAKGEDVIATQMDAEKADAEEEARERAEAAREMFEEGHGEAVEAEAAGEEAGEE
ncbi:MAG TPA: 50S ribosomal protein L9 [Hellea balneolensis]|uniref:Large ribosomal subunit protein bL9 n=1 Tax=Hellea balneolensis TaxID=287478 RepID=A0A7V5NX57_9PROT|nr:50S ribosomal protein L9 [Hellea balneolensis]